MKYFKTYITDIYILLSGIESYFWTRYTCNVFQQKHIQNPFSHPRWSVFAQKQSIVVAWRGSEYSCIQVASNNVLCHRNKYLIGYFEFLYDSGIICLPLNIPEKLHWQQFFQKPKKADSLLGNTIPTHPEEQHLTFKQTGTTTIFSFGYQSCVWPRSHPFFQQNPCSGCNSGIDLLVALEYTLNFVPMPKNFC